MTHRDPPTARSAALRIVRTLRDAGFTACFAGGCVRDMLLGRRPDDYDVATDAPPDHILPLFRRTRKVGVQFGVVIVGVGPHWIEVATFRSDLSYTDGRRPAAVHFSDARHDAERRDFTINGMFFDPIAREVIDYVGGRADLKAGIVRAIGDPAKRFAEDHLRMLRAVRFAARLGFRIEAETRAAIEQRAAAITRVSPERICDELERILTHPTRAVGYRELARLGLLAHLWPGGAIMTRLAAQTERRLASLPRRPVSFELGLATLLLGVHADNQRAICRALRVSNETRDAVLWLSRHVLRLVDDRRVGTADLKLLMAAPRFDELMTLLATLLKSQEKSPGPWRRLLRRAAAIPRDEVAPPPLLTGDDLLAMHVPRGPIYATVLRKVYHAQLDGEIGDRAGALALARRLIADAGLHASPSR